MGYASWSLLGPEWYIPVFICTVLISLVDMFLEMPGSQDELLRVRPIFYMFAISACWIIGANIIHINRALPVDMFFVPYVVSFAAILSIRWKWSQRQGNLASVRRRRVIPRFIRDGNFAVRAISLSLAFLPMNHLLDLELNFALSFITCLLGISVSDAIYWGIGKRYHGEWSRIAFLRLGMLSVLVSSSLVFVAQLWFYR
jgi:hypothetical protein